MVGRAAGVVAVTTAPAEDDFQQVAACADPVSRVVVGACQIFG
jgi:hypothetical protein